MVQKHKRILDAHNRRMQAAIDELNKSRARELDRLHQNHENAKKQMAGVKKSELAPFAKLEKKQAQRKGEFGRGGQSSVMSAQMMHKEGPPSIPSAKEDD